MIRVHEGLITGGVTGTTHAAHSLSLWATVVRVPLQCSAVQCSAVQCSAWRMACRLQESIAAAAGVKASMVRVVLSAGSVIATVTLPLEAAHQARVSLAAVGSAVHPTATANLPETKLCLVYVRSLQQR
jgi:hypothetical protein